MINLEAPCAYKLIRKVCFGGFREYPQHVLVDALQLLGSCGSVSLHKWKGAFATLLMFICYI